MAVRDAEVKIQKAVPVRLRHHLLTRFGSARECPLAPPNSQVRRNYAPGGKEPEGGHQEAALFSGRGAPFLAAVIGCTSMPALHPLTPCAHGILLQSISRCAWGPHHQLMGPALPARQLALAHGPCPGSCLGVGSPDPDPARM